MLSKLAILMVVAAAMGLGAPKAQPTHALLVSARAPEALLRVCLGPVSVKFAEPGGTPVMLEFASRRVCQGFAGLVEIHPVPRHQGPRNYPLTGGLSQKLPSPVRHAP